MFKKIVKEIKDFYFILLVISTLLSFAIKLYWFTRYELIYGVDGGFYALHFKKLLEGNFEFSLYVAPLIFLISLIFLPFGFFNAIKITTCLFSSAIAIPTYYLSKYVSKDKRVALISALLITFFPLSLRIAADIRKNVLGLFFYPIIIYFFLKTLEVSKKGKQVIVAKNFILFLISFVLGILSHKSTFLIYIFLITYCLFILLIKIFSYKVKILFIEKLLIASIFVLLLFSFVIEDINSNLGWLSFKDISTFHEGLQIYLLPLNFFAIFSLPEIFKRLENGKEIRKILLIVAIAISNFIMALPLVSGEQVWRFLLILYFPLSILTSFGIVSFSKLIGKLVKSDSNIFITIITSFLFLLFIFQQYKFYKENFQMRPVIGESEIEALEEIKEIYKSQNVTFVAPHGLEYWVEFYTEKEAVADPFSVKGKAVVIKNIHDEKFFEQIRCENTFVVEPFILCEAEIFNHFNENFEGEEIYSIERLQSVAIFLIAPYEILNILNLPNTFLALLGIPLSSLVLFSLLLLLSRKKLLKYFIPLLLVLLLIYTFSPETLFGFEKMLKEPSKSNKESGTPIEIPEKEVIEKKIK